MYTIEAKVLKFPDYKEYEIRLFSWNKDTGQLFDENSKKLVDVFKSVSELCQFLQFIYADYYIILDNKGEIFKEKHSLSLWSPPID